MARGVNKVILIGHLGADPDTRYMPSGTAVTNARIAVGEQWKDKVTGEKVEKTEWINLVFFGKLGEIAGEYLRKGSQLYVEGKLRTRKWQDREGHDRWTTEINVDQLNMLGSRDSGPASDAGRERSQAPAAAASAPTSDPVGEEFDDEIPFSLAIIGPLAGLLGAAIYAQNLF